MIRTLVAAFVLALAVGCGDGGNNKVEIPKNPSTTPPKVGGVTPGAGKAGAGQPDVPPPPPITPLK